MSQSISQVTEAQIEEMMGFLVSARGSLRQGYSIFPGTPSTELKAPTIREVYDAFQGLPDGHPFKKRFQTEIVTDSFSMIGRLGINPDQPYKVVADALMENVG